MALTLFAMRMEAKLLANDDVSAGELNLLKYLWCFFRNGECAFAFRAAFEFEFDGLVGLLVVEGLALLGFVSFLCSDLASSVFVFSGLGRFNDLGGGRFGGVLRVLFEDGDFGFELGNFFESRLEESFEFGDSFVFGIHKDRGYLFPALDKREIRIKN